MISPVPRPLSILPDGSPLYPVEWQAGPLHVDRTIKRERARFLSGGQGAREGTTVPTATTRKVKAATKERRAAGAQPALSSVVSWAGGSPQAPPSGGSGSEIPVLGADFAPVYRSTPRNVGQNLSTPFPDSETDQRSRRFTRLRMARSILRGTPIGACMRYARNAMTGVQAVMYGESAGYRGWQHCGSRLCPWCCAMLAREDTAKAERFIRGWVKRKNAIALCHYTLRHGAEELPAQVWDAQTRVLQSLHSGRPWRDFVETFGLLEHIYGNEVTDGNNGCHKHQHRAWEIQMCEALAGRKGRRDFGRRMQAAYEKLYMAALAKHGRSALPGIALKVSIAAPTTSNAAKAAEYVAKFSKETQQGGLKSGHRGNHTVFELLDLAADKSLPAAARSMARGRYADLYFGLKGKHWSYFSEAHTAGDDQVGGEEEIPEVALDDEGQVVIELTAMQAAMLADQDMQLHLLELIERQGVEAAKAWLAWFTDPAKWSEEWMQRHRGG